MKTRYEVATGNLNYVNERLAKASDELTARGAHIMSLSVTSQGYGYQFVGVIFFQEPN